MTGCVREGERISGNEGQKITQSFLLLPFFRLSAALTPVYFRGLLFRGGKNGLGQADANKHAQAQGPDIKGVRRSYSIII